MRTTITLDDDIATALERMARRKKTSFKEIVNAVLRRGLARVEPSKRASARYKTPTFKSSFRPGVDMLRLNSLSDELEIKRGPDKNRS